MIPITIAATLHCFQPMPDAYLHTEVHTVNENIYHTSPTPSAPRIEFGMQTRVHQPTIEPSSIFHRSAHKHNSLCHAKSNPEPPLHFHHPSQHANQMMNLSRFPEALSSLQTGAKRISPARPLFRIIERAYCTACTCAGER